MGRYSGADLVRTDGLQRHKRELALQVGHELEDHRSVEAEQHDVLTLGQRRGSAGFGKQRGSCWRFSESVQGFW